MKFLKPAKSFASMLPFLLGIILLISIISVVLPPSIFRSIFTGNPLIDPLIGALAGSISAGNPATSYVLSGEMLERGVSLLAVTSFIVSWVTVGILQLPMEASVLGRKFALLRNLSSFFLSLLVALLTVILVEII